MDLRVQLIQDHEDGHSIAELAELYEVSRKTVDKWLERHEAEGVAGLANRSRTPLHCPSRVSEEMTAQIIAARQRWKWGPRKLRVKLAAQPERVWPAESAIGDVLPRAGLTHTSKKRVRTPPYAQPFAAVEEANQTWCADFKGWFRTGDDGTRCDPLTITGAHSRYLLRCHITPKADGVHVEAVFDAAFREYGLPLVIHTGNGVPFASRAPGRTEPRLDALGEAGNRAGTLASGFAAG